MSRSNKDWVQKAFDNKPGALHRQLKVPMGKDIPDKKLEKLFGSKKPVDMMKLSSIISKHLTKE